jgi:MFS family permease
VYAACWRGADLPGHGNSRGSGASAQPPAQPGRSGSEAVLGQDLVDAGAVRCLPGSQGPAGLPGQPGLLSAGIIGLITSTAAAGGLLGSLIASRVAARLGQGPAIWVAAAAVGPCGFVAPFVHRDWTLVLLAAAQIVMWMGVVVYNVTQVSFRQGLCPPRLLGRMNATMRFLVWGTMPLGGVIGGALSSALGVRATLLVAAAGQSLAFLPVFLSPLRRMRSLPAYHDPAARPAAAPGT